MTNREQIASTIGFTECGDRSVVEEISRMLAEADVAVLGVEDMDRLTTWMGLECDEDNEWGKLEPRTESLYPTWEDAADAYIDSILEQLRDTWPACVLPPTWKQLREEFADWLDDYETSAEPWPDDPDGKLWDKFIDECMEGLRPKIVEALKGCEDSDFVRKFWGDV